MRKHGRSYDGRSVKRETKLQGPVEGEGFQVAPGRPGFLEVRFPSKPSDAVRAELKAHRYRWAASSCCWYGFEDMLPERYRGAIVAASTVDGAGELSASDLSLAVGGGESEDQAWCRSIAAAAEAGGVGEVCPF